MMKFLNKKNILVLIILLFILTPVVVLPNTAHAEGFADSVLGFIGNLVGGPVGGATAQAAATAIQLKAEAIFFGYVASIYGAVLAFVGNTIIWITSWILWLAGILLNFVVKKTVIEMSSNINAIQGIGAAWKVFRDLANLTFIFILLYVAIGTVLNIVDTKKFLTRVIIVALLLNFSMFFTKIIIDAGNIVAVGFYKGISSGPGCSGAVNSADGCLSNAIVQGLYLTSVFKMPDQAVNGVPAAEQYAAVVSAANKLLIGSLGGAFVILVAAMALFAVAGLLITRFVILMFLIMLSPLAFASSLLPKTQQYFKQWMGNLIDQTIFAPLFFALLYAVIVIIRSSTFTNIMEVNQNLSWFDALFGGDIQGMVSMALNYIIVIVFIMAALSIAKKLSSQSSGAIGKAMGGAGNKISGFLGRNTLGRVGANLDKRFGSTETGNSRVGRFVRSYTTGALAEKKFAGEKSAKDMADARKKEGIDIANKDKEIQDRRMLKRGITTAVSPELNRTITAGMGMSEILDYEAQRDREVAARRQEENQFANRVSKIDKKEIEKMRSSEIIANIGHFNSQQVENALGSDNFNDAEKEQIRQARIAPTRQAVVTIDNYNAEKQRIYADNSVPEGVRITRLNDLEQRSAAQVKQARDHIKGLSHKDTELSATEFIDNHSFADSLSKAQVDNIMKPDNNAYTRDQKQRMRSARAAELNDNLSRIPVLRASGSPALATRIEQETRQKIQKSDIKDVAKLDRAVLTSKFMLETYSSGMLTKMGPEMSQDDITAVRNAIDAASQVGGPYGVAVPPKITALANWLDTPTGIQYFS